MTDPLSLVQNHVAIVVVAHLAKRLLPKTEYPGLDLVIGRFNATFTVLHYMEK